MLAVGVLTDHLPPVVLTIRTYALYEKSKRILALILTVALTLFAIACVRCYLYSIISLTNMFYLPMQWGVASQASTTTAFLPVRGCLWETAQGSAARIAIAWEALFALDTLIFGLTVWRTWAVRRRRGHRRTGSGRRAGVGRGRTDILGIVMRDGALYFGVMALVNLANLLTFYLLDVRCLLSFMLTKVLMPTI